MKTTTAAGLRFEVEAAQDWTELLQRWDGWTGSDGIYAVPLSGYEAPGRAGEGGQILVFGDTFIGQVDAQTRQRRGSTMVYNTLGVLSGGQPNPERLRFIWGQGNEGQPAAVFTPTTSQAQGQGKCWYWLQDGFVHNGRMYLMPMLVRDDPAGSEGFKFRDFGVCLIKIPIGPDGLQVEAHEQIDTPFFHVDKRRKLYFGAAFMPLTERAGAPDPDGHIYVYGRYQAVGGDQVELAVARVPQERFEDWDQWRFWDGERWNEDIGATAPLGRGGPELSVTPVADGPLKGRYMLVSMHVERHLYVRLGDSPVGPFGPRIDIWHTREPEAGQGIYTYNAKAHPSLSAPGEWLLSYNVNTTRWDSHMEDGHIYRPRFLRLRIRAANRSGGLVS
ncbi:MAG: DUF4185 domain-containing protein [Candidatus Latescibacteria bacterium]|nr:DUF4185 domain-containing protein [Candidatus Latescibacterota bacterium]